MTARPTKPQSAQKPQKRASARSVGSVVPKSHVQSGPSAEMYPTSPLGEKEANIPTGRDVEWEPLVDYRRFGVSETTIHGAVA